MFFKDDIVTITHHFKGQSEHFLGLIEDYEIKNGKEFIKYRKLDDSSNYGSKIYHIQEPLFLMVKDPKDTLNSITHIH